MCREHIGVVRFFIVSLAVLSLAVCLIGVITPGWYNYEGKLVNYDMKMMIASKMFAEKSKRTIRQAPANFDFKSDFESMPAKAPAGNTDEKNPSQSSDSDSGSSSKTAPAKEIDDEDRPPTHNFVSGSAPDMQPGEKKQSQGDRPQPPKTAPGSLPENPPVGQESNNIPPRPAFRGSDGSGNPNHNYPKRPGNDGSNNLPPMKPNPPDTSGNVPSRPMRPILPETGSSDKIPQNFDYNANQDDVGHTDDIPGQHPEMNTDVMPNTAPGMNTDERDGHNDGDDAEKTDHFTDKRPPVLIQPKTGDSNPKQIVSLNRTLPTTLTRPPIGALPILLPSKRTRQPGNGPGLRVPTRIPLLLNKTRRPGSTKKPKNPDLNNPTRKPTTDEVMDKLDWFAGIRDKLTGSDTKPDWMMGMLKHLKSGNITEGLMDKIDHVEYSIHLGLWFGKICEMLDGVKTCNGEKLSILFGKLKTPDVSLSTWNDLRLESSLSVVFGVLGVLGTILTVKPLCLKTKPRIPVAMAVCGMLLSCVLSITAIARITSIHAHVNEILEDKHSSPHLPPGIEVPTNPCHLSTPWSVVLCGIGAGLAFVTTLTLGLFIWRQERMRWYKFNPDGDLANNDGNKEVYTDTSGNIGQDNRAFESAIGNSKV